MLPKWREKVRDLVGGRIEGAPPKSLIRIAESSDPSRRARALRELGARGHPESIEYARHGLCDPVPGVRRAAAWAAGWAGEPGLGDALVAALAQERCDMPRLAMGIGAVHCGVPVCDAWQQVAEPARRKLKTFKGPRAPAPLAGAGVSDLELLWIAALCPGAVEPAALQPVDPVSALSAARERVRVEPEDRQALLDLAVMGHPDDLETLLSAMRGQGRRMRHAAAAAIGLCGDPRGRGALIEVLHAIDVDPGHGFTGRATAATALGRLGMPKSGKALVRAMRDEALDHEGRPGAGLGIQRPVRASMLAALGELGDVNLAPVIAGYLGNTSGTAHGGYYLQAMDALVKLGARRQAAALLGADEVTAANAQGVVDALKND